METNTPFNKNTSQEKIPEILYHYCSLEAFLNIIKSRSLWMTDVNHTNDKEESRWIARHFKKALSDFTAENKAIVENILTTGYNSYKPLGHIACLSEKGDLLSQWRSYADDGKGVAIGFDSRFFTSEDISSNKTGLILEKIEYDELEQFKYIQEIFNRMIEENKKNDPILLDSEKNSVRILKRYSFVCKNPAFKEENEYRFLHLAEMENLFVKSKHVKRKYINDQNYFVRDNEIVHYVPLDFEFENHEGHLPIKKVILGPKNGNTVSEIIRFLSDFGYDPVHVKPSSASYR